MKITRKLIRILRRLARPDFSPPILYRGICANFLVLANTRYSLYDTPAYTTVVRTWPHFSGNVWYPVPDPEFPKDADKAKEIYYCPSQYWSGEYGALRRDLARHLANEFEKIWKERLKK